MPDCLRSCSWRRHLVQSTRWKKASTAIGCIHDANRKHIILQAVPAGQSSMAPCMQHISSYHTKHGEGRGQQRGQAGIQVNIVACFASRNDRKLVPATTKFGGFTCMLTSCPSLCRIYHVQRSPQGCRFWRFRCMTATLLGSKWQLGLLLLERWLTLLLRRQCWVLLTSCWLGDSRQLSSTCLGLLLHLM